MRECHRRVSFLIAAKSMRQKAIRFFANMVHASKKKKKELYELSSKF
jgi:hypothetical protein